MSFVVVLTKYQEYYNMFGISLQLINVKFLSLILTNSTKDVYLPSDQCPNSAKFANLRHSL